MKPSALARRAHLYTRACLAPGHYGSWVTDERQLRGADGGMNVFGQYAAEYDSYRPTYPAAFWDTALGLLGPPKGDPSMSANWPRDSSRPLAVDVATGTGRGALDLAARGCDVVALDADADMLAQLERTVRGSDGDSGAVSSGAVRTLHGRAEATGLPEGAADLVTVLQAFHWFDAEPALREFHRILRRPPHDADRRAEVHAPDASAPQGGLLVLAWNDRDLTIPWMREYESLLESRNPRYNRALKQAESVIEDGRALTRSGLFCEACPAFAAANPVACSHADVLALTRTFSYVRNALDARELASLEADVGALLCDQFGRGEAVELPWVTKAWFLRPL